jgi:hypothetical protein
MNEYFVLMHPQGMGQQVSDIDLMPEWERLWYLRKYEDWSEEQNNNTPSGGSGGKRSNPRFTRG